MAYTQDDLTALKAAYAAGTLRVKFSDGREVTYADGPDLQRRINAVQAELTTMAGGSRPVGRFAQFSR